MRILIYQPRMFGDIILGTTAAKELKKIYPNASITYITSHRALTETNPYIDFSYERKFPKRFESLYFKFIKNFYTKAFYLKHWLPNKNMLQSYMSELSLDRKNYRTRIYLTDEDIDLAKKYLELIDNEKKIIAIQDDFARKWNAIEVEKIKKMLNKNFNLVQIGDSMIFNNKKLNIRQAAAVTSLCDLYLGGISANLHAAVAVNIPTIGISCAFNPEWDMPEYYQNEFIEEKKKKHITVPINPSKFCGYYSHSYETEKYIHVHGGDYSPDKCFKEINEEYDAIAEKYSQNIIKYPCYCSIDADDVYKLVLDFFNNH